MSDSTAIAMSLGRYAAAVEARLGQLEAGRFAARLWRHDDALWGDDPARRAVAASRLGWLDSPARMRAEAAHLHEFAAGVAREGFTRAVLLGMGGSSLAPEVLRLTFGARPGALDLTVLDDTSPAAVRAVTGAHDPASTLFLVSSKSGTTVEVASFERHFFAWVGTTRGAQAGRAFVAVTDPGTPLERLAAERGYRRVFLNPVDIGGRYSVLSCFGLVPAALIGVDLEALLDSALAEAKACGPDAPAALNPGLCLGAALGELALAGRDKVTLVVGSEIGSLGTWVEQLVAESTGKDGRGLVPVVEEELAEPTLYGPDRVFVAVSVRPLPPAAEARLEALRAAGHPVLRWTLPSLEGLGGEFLRWEIATATAATVLGVDPFDEPNVTEAKQATAAVLDRALTEGRFPEPGPRGEAQAMRAFAPEATAAALARSVDGAATPAAWLTALLSLAGPGDYFAVLAYVHRTPGRHERLQRLRHAARAATHCATTLGYGPRFLHSTGQLHKGGPNTGVFLQLTADEGTLPIPGARYDFGLLHRAQAAGDYAVLERRGRRVLRVHLGSEIERGLDALIAAVAAAGGG